MPASAPRPASPEDAALFAELARAALPEGWPEAEFERALARPETRALVAPPARGVLLGRRSADEAELLVLVVAAGERRRGLGRALVAAFLARLREEGVTRVSLEVRGSNREAQALYAGLGFAAAGRRTRYYSDGEDALVLGTAL